MKNVFLAVVLGFVGSVLSYNANINVNHYGSCEKEIRSYQLDHRHQYIKPHTFLYIPDLANNDAKVDEILRTKIYFRGFGDFSVGVSQYPNSENTPFFHTVMAYGSQQNSKSAIFKKWIKENIENIHSNCDEINNIPNFFSEVYYEELTLVVTKAGVMTWHIPDQKQSFLKCSDTALKNIEYISFSGFRPTEVYYADCPKHSRCGCSGK